MDIQKNKQYIVSIIDNGFEGEGIAKIDNFTIFVPNAIKGEKVKISILKVNKSYAYAKIIDILEPSSSRNNNFNCDTYKRCGGCNLRHMDYNSTLELKRYIVENCLKKALGYEIYVNETIGMENPLHYRNKLQYPVGIGEDGQTLMGVYAMRTHKIIPTTNCSIQDKLSQEIANNLFDFIKKNNIEPYNEKTRQRSCKTYCY